MMTEFVQSLKRLYQQQRLPLSQVQRLLKAKAITQQEYTFIISKDGD